MSPEEQRKIEINAKLEEIKNAAAADPEYEEKLIDLILNQSAGIYLAGSNQSSPLRVLSSTAFQRYFEQLYAQISGSKFKDPIHRMMIEQLAVAHHVIGRLMIDSGNCKDSESLRTQVTLAVQLMGEFRRMCQAANSYVPQSQGDKTSPTQSKSNLDRKRSVA